MRSNVSERCDFCGGRAVAYQRGSRVCGQCGTRRTLNEPAPPRRTRRMAIIGLFSSGLLFKMMLGYVALAAVGGWVANTVFAPPPPIVTSHSGDETSSTTLAGGSAVESREAPLGAAAQAMSMEELVSVAAEEATRAHEFAAATQEWANCVSASAIAHRGGEFSPWDVCPGHPQLSDFGLGEGLGRPDSPPGWVNKPEDPGKSNSRPPGDETQVDEDNELKEQPGDGKRAGDENDPHASDGQSQKLQDQTDDEA